MKGVLVLTHVLALALSGNPASAEIVLRWPDGGVRQSRVTTDGGVIETTFYATGERWIEVAGGVKRTFAPEGWLTETVALNRFGNAHGPMRRFHSDGGLLTSGTFNNGAQLGAWTTWWSNGQLESQRVFTRDGDILVEVHWASDGWKQRERKAGMTTEYLPDGGLSSVIRETGRIDTYLDGRLVQQEQGGLLINAWGPDGGLLIRDGNGERLEKDPELGTPHLVRYRSGKPIRP